MLDQPYYQTQNVDFEIARDNWLRENDRPGDPSDYEPKEEVSVLDLEEFAFDLLNQLADEYGIYDNGSFTQAIWAADTPEKMQPIINQLQTHLLIAMKDSVGL